MLVTEILRKFQRLRLVPERKKAILMREKAMRRLHKLGIFNGNECRYSY